MLAESNICLNLLWFTTFLHNKARHEKFAWQASIDTTSHKELIELTTLNVVPSFIMRGDHTCNYDCTFSFIKECISWSTRFTAVMPFLSKTQKFGTKQIDKGYKLPPYNNVTKPTF